EDVVVELFMSVGDLDGQYLASFIDGIFTPTENSFSLFGFYYNHMNGEEFKKYIIDLFVAWKKVYNQGYDYGNSVIVDVESDKGIFFYDDNYELIHANGKIYLYYEES